ncbi:hypothetical protein EV191_1011180 [Tamaricihabitans halophyticus]|uniref:Uncharacterized protein n=1 Tax=Tamaricihabitans halophyticus TaxID=1262583 RepID=A0A4R2R5B8_9PSEU|nr:hypothetical protein [Tamaricihabitans halophyticus]TCP57227.1 hypothetical protein EV191_1011180 [Tamaricihabitans halophyticus]
MAAPFIRLGIQLVRLAATAGGAIARSRRNRRIARVRHQLGSWCASNGWSYRDNVPDTLLNYFDGTPFTRGTMRELRHVLTATYQDRPVLVSELGYYYPADVVQYGSGPRTRTSMRGNPGGTVQAGVVQLPAAVPRLQVARAGLLSSAAEVFGVRDLQLESVQFNQTFQIGCDIPRFAYDVLHPRTMEWLLTDPRAAEIGWRFDGPNLIGWRNGWLSGPGDVLTMANFLCELADRVPSFVYNNGWQVPAGLPHTPLRYVPLP